MIKLSLPPFPWKSSKRSPPETFPKSTLLILFFWLFISDPPSNGVYRLSAWLLARLATLEISNPFSARISPFSSLFSVASTKYHFPVLCGKTQFESLDISLSLAHPCPTDSEDWAYCFPPTSLSFWAKSKFKDSVRENSLTFFFPLSKPPWISKP